MRGKLNGYTRIDMWICRMSTKGYILDCYRIDNPDIKKKPVTKITENAARLRHARGEFEPLLLDVKPKVKTEVETTEA